MSLILRKDVRVRFMCLECDITFCKEKFAPGSPAKSFQRVAFNPFRRKQLMSRYSQTAYLGLTKSWCIDRKKRESFNFISLNVQSSHHDYLPFFPTICQNFF